MSAFEQLELAAGTVIPQLDEYNALSEKESDIFSQLSKDDQFKLILKWPLPIAPEIIPFDEEPKKVPKPETTFTIDGEVFEIGKRMSQRNQYQASLQIDYQIPLEDYIQRFVTPFLQEQQLSSSTAEPVYTKNVQSFEDEALWDEKKLKTQMKKSLFTPLKENIEQSLDAFSPIVLEDVRESLKKIRGMTDVKVTGRFEMERPSLRWLGTDGEPDFMLSYMAKDPKGNGFPMKGICYIGLKPLKFNLSACYDAMMHPDEHHWQLINLQRSGKDPNAYGVATKEQVEELENLLMDYTTMALHTGVLRFVITNYKNYLMVNVPSSPPELAPELFKDEYPKTVKAEHILFNGTDEYIRLYLLSFLRMTQTYMDDKAQAAEVVSADLQKSVDIVMEKQRARVLKERERNV